MSTHPDVSAMLQYAVNEAFRRSQCFDALLSALEAVEKLLNVPPAMMMHDTDGNHVCYPKDDISKALGALHAALLLARGECK